MSESIRATRAAAYPAILVSIVLLLANDHVLNAVAVSDFAGQAFFPPPVVIVIGPIAR